MELANKSREELLEYKNRLLKEREAIIKENENRITFNDTDSCGVTLENLKPFAVTKDQKVTAEGYALIEKLNKYIDENLELYVKTNFNTKRSTLSFKREKICDVGLYRKKKNYILHVIDDEGKRNLDGTLKTKWHYAGIELAKAIMTKEVKEIGKKVIEAMILKQDKNETDRILKESFEEFKKLPLQTTCKLARIKSFDKYVKESDMFKCAKGMQEHLRAAYYHNLLLKILGLTEYEEIMQGDTCQVIPLKTNNKYKIDCIAFKNGIIPNEFSEIFEPNYVTIFEKPFLACISSLYEVAGWECPNVTDEYEDDLMGYFS